MTIPIIAGPLDVLDLLLRVILNICMCVCAESFLR
jgi:hypothetical protein